MPLAANLDTPSHYVIESSSIKDSIAHKQAALAISFPFTTEPPTTDTKSLAERKISNEAVLSENLMKAQSALTAFTNKNEAGPCSIFSFLSCLLRVNKGIEFDDCDTHPIIAFLGLETKEEYLDVMTQVQQIQDKLENDERFTWVFPSAFLTEDEDNVEALTEEATGLWTNALVGEVCDSQKAIEQEMNRIIEEAIGIEDAITFDPSWRCAISSGLKFNGKFEVPFDTTNTHAKTFTCANGDETEVLMMQNYKLENVQMLKKDSYTICSIPFSSKESALPMSLEIYLPDSDQTLEDMVKRLNEDGTFFTAQKAAKTTSLNLTMPKISFKERKSFEPDEPLFLTRIKAEDYPINAFQQVLAVEVDEEGAEVKAVTTAMNCTCSPPSLVKEFTVDRPFVMQIVAEDGNLKYPICQAEISDAEYLLK